MRQKSGVHTKVKTTIREDPEFHHSHVAVTGVVNHEISIKFEGAVCMSYHPRHVGSAVGTKAKREFCPEV